MYILPFYSLRWHLEHIPKQWDGRRTRRETGLSPPNLKEAIQAKGAKYDHSNVREHCVPQVVECTIDVDNKRRQETQLIDTDTKGVSCVT